MSQCSQSLANRQTVQVISRSKEGRACQGRSRHMALVNLRSIYVRSHDNADQAGHRSSRATADWCDTSTLLPTLPDCLPPKQSRMRMVFNGIQQAVSQPLGQSGDGLFRGVSWVSLQIPPATVGLYRVHTHRAVAGNDGA